ncbi:MAG: putative prolin-rich transrane protein [Labilithrix sp.]|nr:putative prolin-rich transrane protein [Labilithrix sp.]
MNTPSVLRSLSLAVVLASVASVAVGCGPSPAYEEPRTPRAPVTYAASGDQEPLTSEQLAAANEQRQAQGGGDIAVGNDSDDEYADTDPSALTEFKPALDGHGEWVDDPTYGTIWVPASAEVGSDFVPYSTAGHWTYDEAQDYVWVSDYSWGWAPFHYGRWVRVNHHGWAWIPGRRYAGAWVTWRVGDPGYEYVGWAPMGPDWYWYNGYAVGWTFGYTPYWGYCHRDYLWTPGYGGYYYGGYSPRAHDIESHTHPYSAPPAGRGSDRYAASPSVGGGGRVAASPRVGPSPASLGVKADRVLAPPIGHDAGLARAQLLAQPRTAVVAGAAAPVQTRRRPLDRDLLVTDPSRAPGAGAGLGGAHVDATARAPQYQPNGGGARSSSIASPTARPFSTSPTMTQGSTQPTLRTSPAFPSQPASRPMPVYTPSPSQPTFRSAPQPSQPSQPSQRPVFRPSPSPSQPTFRAAPSQPTFRPSPSAPASRPSTPSFRPSAPSAPVSHPSNSVRSPSTPRRR